VNSRGLLQGQRFSAPLKRGAGCIQQQAHCLDQLFLSIALRQGNALYNTYGLIANGLAVFRRVLSGVGCMNRYDPIDLLSPDISFINIACFGILP
jgi:hypothetical protein